MPGECAQVRRRPTPPWWDAAVAAGFLVFGSLLFAVDAAALDPSRGEQVPVLVRSAVLALGCAAQVLRARRPGTALGVGVVAVGADVALEFSIPVLLVFVNLLYCAALHGSRQTSTVVAATLVLTAAAEIVAAC